MLLTNVFAGEAAQAEDYKEVNRIQREVVKVEPYSGFLGKLTPVSVATKYAGTVYVSGIPPFDETGKIVKAPIKEQTEIVLDQLDTILKAAGSSRKNVLKCTVYCTSVDYFEQVNEVYRRYFPDPDNAPARIFVNLPKWPGPHDIEIDCVAATD